MKKRTFVCFFIFTISVFHFSIPNVVFGELLADRVFEKYKNTLTRPDIQPLIPTVLRAFKGTEIQDTLHQRDIMLILSNPFALINYDSRIDPQFIGLLGIDNDLRTFFADDQFYNVLDDPREIDGLVRLIEDAEPIKQPDPNCPVPPKPELPKARTLSIVSGFGQEGDPDRHLSLPFVVEVRDQYGVVFPGVNVDFRITKGDGTVSPTTVPTNNRGQASTILTLGNTAGATWVEARVAGIQLTQTFTATAIAPREDTERDETEEEPPLPPMYWIEGNRIYYRLSGGGKEIFNAPQDGTLTGGLAVDRVGEKVYWTEKTLNNGGRIRRADLDKTDVQTVKEILAVPFNIAVGTDEKNKRWVYWTNSNQKIQRINVNDNINVDKWNFQGNFMEFSGLPKHILPKHIAFDQGEYRLYWTEMGRIRGVAAHGKEKRDTIAQDLGELGGIAVANGVIYWTGQTNGLGRVRSINRTGESKKLLAVTESIPVGIAVDPTGRKVYWTTADGEIQSVPLMGAVQTVVMRGTGPAAGIALGGTTRMSSSSVASAPSVSSVDSVVSVENTLLANYPNPFNPETWIPYQLSASVDVSVSIYSVNGHLVRRLELGHQSAGVYRSRSRAAYWDGRNEFGERVASGLYFYTLTAGDFTATRKMLIRK